MDIFYYRIVGEKGVYIFTKQEIDTALDRENFGIKYPVKTEKDYCKNSMKTNKELLKKYYNK